MGVRIQISSNDINDADLVGQNLNDAKHIGYLQEIATFPTEVQRSIYGQIKWEF